jgi:outer membrane protein OmpA-like peptidoglycan-associated protein
MLGKRSILLLYALLLPASALAQGEREGFDGHGFNMVADDGDLQDLMVTWRGEPQQFGAIGVNGVFEYANRPLVLRVLEGDDKTTTPLVEHVLALNIAGSFGLHERVAVGLSTPVYLVTVGQDFDGTSITSGPALGDLRVVVPINLAYLGEEETGTFGFSVIPFGVLPTGPEDRFLGSASAYAGGLLAATYGTEKVSVSLHIGAQSGNKLQYENVTGGAQLLTAAGLSYLLTDTLALRGEVRFDPSLNPSAYPDDPTRPDIPVNFSEAPGEAYLSARGHAGEHLYWTTGLSTAFTPGISAASLRVFAGVGFMTGKDRSKDLDGDGFVDSLDICPEEMETYNEWKDDDGCPDELAKVKFKALDANGKPVSGVQVIYEGEDLGRTNSSGLVTTSDRMPGTTAAVSASADAYAPLDLEVALEEGVQTREFTLEGLPRPVRAVAKNQEDAPIDATLSFASGPEVMEITNLGEDGEAAFELMPGDWTLVFAHDDYGSVRRPVALAPGTTEMVVDVVMEPAKVEVTEVEVVTLEEIFFDFDKATIKPVSMRIVEEIAATLLGNPHIKLLEVQGHTSSEGTEQYNQDLSQRRVESVVAALVERGVERGRLTPKGYGESQPITSNDTEAGREKNRRVQFVILDPAPPE